MLQDYIQSYSLKTLIVGILALIMSVYCLFQIYNSKSILSQRKKLQFKLSTLGSIGLSLSFLYSVVTVILYEDNVTNFKKFVMGLVISITLIVVGVLNITYKKELADKTYSQFLSFGFLIGIFLMVGLVFYYFKWLR